MGGRRSDGGGCLSLWIEHAHRCLARSGRDACADVVRTFQNEEQFFSVLVSGRPGGVQGRERAQRTADEAAASLASGGALDEAMGIGLAALPEGQHAPFAMLQVLDGRKARVIECDAPPLFLVRGGHLVLLPVLEEERQGHLVRGCRFAVEHGDHLAMVSEAFLRPRGRRWGWPDIAVAVRRWTEINCDAQELLGALVRLHQRLNPGPLRGDVAVVAMHARPLRTATVWTGPPARPERDERVLRDLMAEDGTRIICGGTTAQIAARLMEAELETERRPANGAHGSHPWAEVPPISHLAGVHLVTEGLVTLRVARERMAEAARSGDLPRGEDGATRLARALLAADRIRFLVGLAPNPQQVDAAGVPLRRAAVEALVCELRERGKLVSTEYC